MQLFEERWQDGLRPNGIAYSDLISTRKEGSVPVNALHLSDDMRHVKLQPKVITYHTIINARKKTSFSERALQLFVEKRHLQCSDQRIQRG